MGATALTTELKRCANLALDLLLPRHCVLCGMASGNANLCGPCSAALPRNLHACQRCGLTLPLRGGPVCGNCLRKPPPWNAMIAALAYRFPVDGLVRRFKFNRDLACGKVLAAELIAALRRESVAPPDCIVPVPLHRFRHVLRTFNQAELIARELGRAIGIPVQPSLLRRVRRTRAQSGLNAAERRRNVKGAFGITPSATDKIPHKVALVDDVMTTGVTLAVCTQALRRAGVRDVAVWVAARAPVPGRQ